jgi:hypothetical protein
MPDNFAKIAATPPEYVEIADERITSEILLHLQSQTAHAAAHIGMAHRYPYPNARWNRDHAFNASNTADTNAGEAAADIRTVEPPTSTAIAEQGADTTGTSCTVTAAKPWLVPHI